MAELTRERLREVLEYWPDTGLFFRKMPASRRHPEPWRKPACGKNNKGYICIGIDGRIYKAHRLAWLWMTGAWPDGEIDHRDLDKSNNRFSNLRVATSNQNQANRPKRSTNTSGYKGVILQQGKWTARIGKDRKRYFLGIFDNREDASAAYNAKAIELYGDFARVSP